MKKIILTSVVCFCFLFPSFAQFRYGVKGGFNFANVKHIGSTDNKMRLGFNTGFFMQIGIVKQFMIQPEILYSVKGYSFPATVYNSNGALRLNYLAIPVLARFSPAAGFALLFGPEFGLLLNANSEFDGKDHDVSRNFRKLDIGVDLGASYHIKGGFGMELRYNYGFEDLADVTLTDSTGSIISKDRRGSNRGFQFGVYYRFPK